MQRVFFSLPKVEWFMKLNIQVPKKLDLGIQLLVKKIKAAPL